MSDNPRLENVAMSLIAALGLNLIYQPDWGYWALILGLGVGITLAALLFFFVDRNFDIETAFEIKAYIWSFAVMLLFFGSLRYLGDQLQ